MILALAIILLAAYCNQATGLMNDPENRMMHCLDHNSKVCRQFPGDTLKMHYRRPVKCGVGVGLIFPLIQTVISNRQTWL
jgi:hypothetical protein